MQVRSLLVSACLVVVMHICYVTYVAEATADVVLFFGCGIHAILHEEDCELHIKSNQTIASLPQKWLQLEG